MRYEYLVFLIIVIIATGCINKEGYTSVWEIYERNSSFIGSNVSVFGKVTTHFEGCGASGSCGHSLVIKDGEYELFLSVAGQDAAYGSDRFNPIAYYNNVVNSTQITIGKSYLFTGTITTDRYNPGRLYLEIRDVEEAKIF